MAEGEELCVERREEDEGTEGKRATRQLVKERSIHTFTQLNTICYLGDS